MKSKILVDTCVLIAASTYHVSQEYRKNIKHPFFEQSNSLLNFIRENIAKRIGIFTETIETQSYRALDNAVGNELETKRIDRAKDFPVYSKILNHCSQRLKNFCSVLVREPIDKELVQKNYLKVDELYGMLSEQAVRKIAEFRATRWTSAAAKRFRKIAGPIYAERQKKEDFQLTNLIRNPVKPSDKWILAEAIYLLTLFNNIESAKLAFFICSTDHHFPLKDGVEESNLDK